MQRCYKLQEAWCCLHVCLRATPIMGKPTLRAQPTTFKLGQPARNPSSMQSGMNASSACASDAWRARWAGPKGVESGLAITAAEADKSERVSGKARAVTSTVGSPDAVPRCERGCQSSRRESAASALRWGWEASINWPTPHGYYCF